MACNRFFHMRSSRRDSASGNGNSNFTRREGLIGLGVIAAGSAATGCIRGRSISPTRDERETNSSTDTPKGSISTQETSTKVGEMENLVAKLGSKPKFEGVTVIKQFRQNRAFETREVGGESGWVMDIDDGPKAMYLDITDHYELPENGIDITIRYLDKGDGNLFLRYRKGESIIDAGSFTKLDSGEWSEHTWTVNDSEILNDDTFGENIQLRNLKGDFIISEIRIEPHRVDLEVEQHQMGNIFTGDESPRLDIETRGANIAVEVLDYWGRMVHTEEYAIEDREYSLLLPVDRYGHYEVHLTAFKNDTKIGNKETDITLLPPLEDIPTIDDTFFGMQGHFGYNWDPEIIPLMQKAGVRTFRDSHRWPVIETERGSYSYPERYQRFMAAAEAAGLEPLLGNDQGNPIYYGDRSIEELPADDETRRAYGRFIATEAAKYDGTVTAFDTWNEPNLFSGNPPYVPDNAKQYAKLFQEAYPVINESSPDTTVVAGAYAWSYFVGGDPFEYATRVFENGGLDYMDAVSIHPYRRQWTPESETQNDEDVGTFRTQINRWQELTAEYNEGTPKPIWITEFGWAGNKRGINQNVNLRMHSQIIVRSYVMARAAGAERVYWYTFQDKTKQVQGQGLIRDQENPFGRYTPKPTYATFATMTRQLAGADFKSDEHPDKDIYSYAFERNGEKIHVLWTESDDTVSATPHIDDTADVVLTTDEPITMTDPMGNEETLNPIEGGVPLTLTESPIYVTGENITVENRSMVSMSVESTATGEPLDVTIACDYQADVSIELQGEKYALEETETNVNLPTREYTGSHAVIGYLRSEGTRVGRIMAPFLIEE
jgi:hypothetical protein